MEQGPRRERPEIECREVEPASCLRIGIEEHLEPAIDPEAIDEVGRDASAYPIARLEDQARDAMRLQGPRRREAGEARSDDDDLWSLRNEGMDNSFPTP